MPKMRARERIALALDLPSLDAAKPLLTHLGSEVGCVKVGLELFTAEGPEAVRVVRASGAECFLDLKLHDIPATVARAAEAAARLGARYLTVHASSGPAALNAARKAIEGSTTRLLAVTALTSLDEAALRGIGWTGSAEEIVRRLASLAFAEGIDGFVCSAAECPIVREVAGADAFLVVPGVRPRGSERSDQARVATPAEAMRSGADLLVVGRPIRDAADPFEAVQAIAREIASVTGEAV